MTTHKCTDGEFELNIQRIDMAGQVDHQIEVDGELIACTFGDVHDGKSPTIEEALANAHMLVQAKLMYEALSVAMDYIDQSICDRTCIPQRIAWEELQKLNPESILALANPERGELCQKINQALGRKE